MPAPILGSFLDVLEAFRIALSAPSYANMVVVAWGWVLTRGMHAVTEALVVTRVAGRRHHEAFHRFFSRGTGSRTAWASGCSSGSSGFWVAEP